MAWRQRKARLIAWWVAIGSLGIAAFVFGYWGFTKQLGADYRPTDLVYLTTQLFTFESGAVDPPAPWQLEIARFLAPLTMASAIVRVIVSLLRNRLRLARLAFYRDHVVVAGLGRRGLRLVDDAIDRGHRVVCIDRIIADELKNELSDKGAIVIEGDVTRDETLLKSRAHYAKHVLAVCSSDGTNVEAGLNVYKLVQRDPQSHASCTVCRVETADFALSNVLRANDMFKRLHGACEVIQFSSYENAARKALMDYPLDYKRIAADDARSAHLIICGFGQMGESLAVQAAKTAHYANGKKLHITVIDREAAAREQSFRLRFPQFEECCAINFVTAEFEDSHTIYRIHTICSSSEYLSSAAICFDNDARNVQYALYLRGALDDFPGPILVRISEEQGLARLLSEHPDKQINVFGAVRDASSWDALMGETTDRMARFIHNAYVEEQRRLGKPKGPNTESWDRLPGDLRDSNRQQADHIPVKLRAIGVDVHHPEDAAGMAIELDDGQIELLAQMEHARWNADRFLNGWTIGEKDVAAKRTPYLVPYEELPDDIKQYDRDAVVNIVGIVKSAAAQR